MVGPSSAQGLQSLQPAMALLGEAGACMLSGALPSTMNVVGGRAHLHALEFDLCRGMTESIAHVLGTVERRPTASGCQREL